MKKILAPRYLMLIILGISLCLPHSVYAFPNHHFTCPFKGIIMAVLGITDGQMASFNELKAETRAEIEPLAEEMMELGRQIPEILLVEEINTVDAKEKLEQMVWLKCQISSTAANAKLKRAQILTPEQRKIIKEKIGEWRNHHPWSANLGF